MLTKLKVNHVPHMHTHLSSTLSQGTRGPPPNVVEEEVGVTYLQVERVPLLPSFSWNCKSGLTC